eukprot:COSAG02_NODE_13524_length_1383_cov_1.232866_3_plen_128_part_01
MLERLIDLCVERMAPVGGTDWDEPKKAAQKKKLRDQCRKSWLRNHTLSLKLGLVLAGYCKRKGVPFHSDVGETFFGDLVEQAEQDRDQSQPSTNTEFLLKMWTSPKKLRLTESHEVEFCRVLNDALQN